MDKLARRSIGDVGDHPCQGANGFADDAAGQRDIAGRAVIIDSDNAQRIGEGVAHLIGNRRFDGVTPIAADVERISAVPRAGGAVTVQAEIDQALALHFRALPVKDANGDGRSIDAAVGNAVCVGGLPAQIQHNAVRGLACLERRRQLFTGERDGRQGVINGKGGAGHATVAHPVGGRGFQGVLTSRRRGKCIEPRPAVARTIGLGGDAVDHRAVGPGQAGGHTGDGGSGVDGVDREPVGLVGQVGAPQGDIDQRLIGIDGDKLLIGEIEPGRLIFIERSHCFGAQHTIVKEYFVQSTFKILA